MEQEVVKTVLQEILQELKAQNECLVHLEKGMEGFPGLRQEIDQKLAHVTDGNIHISDDQIKLIKDMIHQHFEKLGVEIAKHPRVSVTHKHFTLLPQSFRMEHFPLLVDTVMKWVVALLVLFFLMWVTTKSFT